MSANDTWCKYDIMNHPKIRAYSRKIICDVQSLKCTLSTPLIYKSCALKALNISCI